MSLPRNANRNSNPGRPQFARAATLRVALRGVVNIHVSSDDSSSIYDSSIATTYYIETYYSLRSAPGTRSVSNYLLALWRVGRIDAATTSEAFEDERPMNIVFKNWIDTL